MASPDSVAMQSSPATEYSANLKITFELERNGVRHVGWQALTKAYRALD